MMGKKEKKIVVFPNEIKENILSRVPVKTIVRFISVCKSWYSLFFNPYFINMHQENNPNNKNLILARLRFIELVVMEPSSQVRYRLNLDPQLDNYKRHYIDRTLVSSCNGLVCVDGIAYCSIDDTFSEYMCLWNPALRISKHIKKGDGHLNHRAIFNKRSFLGFEFHSQSNDYKAIKFQKSVEEVEIYSLSLDSWRTVKAVIPLDIRGFGEGSHTRRSSVFVNGAHHWNVELWYSPLIVSFDTGEEVFKEICIPTECKKMHIILFNYNESLAMFSFTRNYDSEHHFIWVMKDYGLPESWNNLWKIDVTPPLDGVYCFGLDNIIRNELIFTSMYSHQHLIVLDVDKLQVKANNSSNIANIEALKFADDVTSFGERLYLLDSANLVHNNQVD